MRAFQSPQCFWVVSYGCFKGMIRFSYFFQGVAVRQLWGRCFMHHRGMVCARLANEVGLDQISAILSVMNVTLKWRVKIEYSSGKMTFPSEAAHSSLIFNFYIR
jgi:hypothetical protein